MDAGFRRLGAKLRAFALKSVSGPLGRAVDARWRADVARRSCGGQVAEPRGANFSPVSSIGAESCGFAGGSTGRRGDERAAVRVGWFRAGGYANARDNSGRRGVRPRVVGGA